MNYFKHFFVDSVDRRLAAQAEEGKASSQVFDHNARFARLRQISFDQSYQSSFLL